MSEYAAALTDKLDDLKRLARSGTDKRELLALLKETGCSKMGVRQKLATILMCELTKSEAPAAPLPTSHDASNGGDFWSVLANDSSLATSFDLPPPTTAEADQALLAVPKPPPSAVAVAPIPEAVLTPRSVVTAEALLLTDEEQQEGPPEAAPEATPEAAPQPQAEASSCRAAESAPPRSPQPTAQEMGARAHPTPSDAAVSSSAPLPPAAPVAPSDADHTPSEQEQQATLFRKLGDEAFGRKDVAAAERWFSQALRATPDSVPLLSRLAACATAVKPPQPVFARRALAHLRAACRLPPPHGDVRLRAGKICLELGELDEALEHCDAGLAADGGVRGVDGDLSDLATKLTEQRSEVAYTNTQAERSRVYTRDKRMLEALHAAKFVRRACTLSLLGTTLAVEALQGAARLEEAIEEAQAGAERLPDDPSARLLYARALSRKGRVQEAEAELVAMGDLVLSGAPAASLAESREGFERAEAALLGLRAAVGHKAAGNTAYGAGQYERAITCYTEGLQADSEGMITPTLFGNRSQAYCKVSSYALAVKDLDAALAMDRDVLKLRLRRAACLIELNDLPGAVREYEDILEVDPENAQALAGIERAEEVESGADGRKGGLIEFEDEKLDPYQVLDVPKDANAVQIKAAFRKLALKLHPDKHEGADDAEKAQIAKQFRRVRIAHAVLSDPDERNKLDESGYLCRKKGAEPPIKPFHEYYSINTPEGYTRGGDFVSTRRYDPMVGATDMLGRVVAAEKMSRKMIRQREEEEVILLKGPNQQKLLGFHDSANAPDQYNQYWDKMKLIKPSMKEESANNWKPEWQPKPIAQTRYMPLEYEYRDETQKRQLEQRGIKGGHCEH